MALKSWWSNFREDQKEEKVISTLKNKKKQLVETEKNIKKWFGNAWDGVKKLKLAKLLVKMGRNANHFGGEMKKCGVESKEFQAN